MGFGNRSILLIILFVAHTDHFQPRKQRDDTMHTSQQNENELPIDLCTNNALNIQYESSMTPRRKAKD